MGWRLVEDATTTELELLLWEVLRAHIHQSNKQGLILQRFKREYQERYGEEPSRREVNKFKELVEDNNKECDRGYDISFSYGIVEFDADSHQTIDKLLTEGDLLMYEGKKSQHEIK